MLAGPDHAATVAEVHARRPVGQADEGRDGFRIAGLHQQGQDTTLGRGLRIEQLPRQGESPAAQVPVDLRQLVLATHETDSRSAEGHECVVDAARAGGALPAGRSPTRYEQPERANAPSVTTVIVLPSQR